MSRAGGRNPAMARSARKGLLTPVRECAGKGCSAFSFHSDSTAGARDNPPAPSPPDVRRRPFARSFEVGILTSLARTLECRGTAVAGRAEQLSGERWPRVRPRQHARALNTPFCVQRSAYYALRAMSCDRVLRATSLAPRAWCQELRPCTRYRELRTKYRGLRTEDHAKGSCARQAVATASRP